MSTLRQFLLCVFRFYLFIVRTVTEHSFVDVCGVVVLQAFESKQWQARRTRFQQGGERGRQPISFRSCVEDSEHRDQKAAQVASAPPGPLSEVKTKPTEIGQVDRNRARWIRLGYEWFGRRTILPARQETGKLQEDRSKAVIAKAIAEATKAVETCVRRLRVTPPKSAKAATASYPAE